MFTDRQKLISALAGVTFLGAAGTWYGVHYYVDKADCGSDVKRANVATTKIRADLATDQNDAVNTLLNGVGQLILHPDKANTGKQYRSLFESYKAETDRISAEREKHPILELPDCDGGN